MPLDLPTFFAVTVLANGAAGVLLFLSWVHYRNIPALAIWGAGFALGSVASALLGTHGHGSEFISIIAANGLLALAYGVMWAGVRSFVGRRAPVAAVLAGAVLWLVACQFDAFYRSVEVRVVFLACVVGAYLLMSAWEFWRSPERPLFWRWPIIVVLLIHAGAYFARIPMAAAWRTRPEAAVLRLDWLAAVAGEALLFVFCCAYLLGSMAYERVALRHKTDAHSDPLTGVANRRAFFSRGENLVRRAWMGRQAAALLLFDLDDFKRINDTYGHQVGDRVIRMFCAVALRQLRPSDLFGRLGGEEFACLLPGISMNDAAHAADRIRSDFHAAAVEHGPARVRTTVSIGVASLENGLQTLSELILAADRALYRAKANGRNRVEPPATVTIDERKVAGAR